MGNRHWEVAQGIVKGFRAELDDEALAKINEAQWNELSQMICDAVAEEISDAATQVEELANKLRALAQKREIGL